MMGRQTLLTQEPLEVIQRQSVENTHTFIDRNSQITRKKLISLLCFLSHIHYLLPML